MTLRHVLLTAWREYTRCLNKNVPSLAGYGFNTHLPFFFKFWHICSADIQKSATGITLWTTSLLLTLFCSEVKWRKWRVFHVTVIASRDHSAEHHRQGRWSMESTTAYMCDREGEGASFWTSVVNNRFFSEPPTTKQDLFRAIHSLPDKTRCTLRV